MIKIEITLGERDIIVDALANYQKEKELEKKRAEKNENELSQEAVDHLSVMYDEKLAAIKVLHNRIDNYNDAVI